MLNIISLLSVDTPLFVESKKMSNSINESSSSLSAAHFKSKYGDHLTLLHYYIYYKKMKKNKQQNKFVWSGLNMAAFSFALKINRQLMSIIRKLVPNNYADDFQLNNEQINLNVLKCFSFGLRQNVARLDASKAFYRHVILQLAQKLFKALV